MLKYRSFWSHEFGIQWLWTTWFPLVIINGTRLEWLLIRSDQRGLQSWFLNNAGCSKLFFIKNGLLQPANWRNSNKTLLQDHSWSSAVIIGLAYVKAGSKRSLVIMDSKSASGGKWNGYTSVKLTILFREFINCYLWILKKTKWWIDILQNEISASSIYLHLLKTGALKSGVQKQGENILWAPTIHS
jgi:hypothetical protein